MSKDMSEEMQCTPPELAEIASSTIESLTPAKSRKVYEFAYKRFLEWAQKHNAGNYTENVLLAYFSQLSQKMKSSSLWAQYSMIKSQLNVKHNTNIEKYTKLITFLKRQSEGYKPKKSKVLSKQEFDDFLHNAPNSKYLATKVILIFGVAGACRCDELLHMTVNDIEDLGHVILVKIPNTKTKKSRSFTIIGDFYLKMYKDYASLRPKDINLTRFFIKYQDGKCHRVVMGIHKIANVPKEIASYLKLANPNEYTGHCLRRTSATLLVDNGADITSLKRHGGWKSGSVAEGYIDDSIANKTETAMKILTPLDYNEPSTSAEFKIPQTVTNIENIDLTNVPTMSTNNTIVDHTNKVMNIDTGTASSGLNIQNSSVTNCTFNITVINK